MLVGSMGGMGKWGKKKTSKNGVKRARIYQKFIKID
jgi:hypothetical protein